MAEATQTIGEIELSQDGDVFGIPSFALADRKVASNVQNDNQLKVMAMVFVGSFLLLSLFKKVR